MDPLANLVDVEDSDNENVQDGAGVEQQNDNDGSSSDVQRPSVRINEDANTQERELHESDVEDPLNVGDVTDSSDDDEDASGNPPPRASVDRDQDQILEPEGPIAIVAENVGTVSAYDQPRSAIQHGPSAYLMRVPPHEYSLEMLASAMIDLSHRITQVYEMTACNEMRIHQFLARQEAADRAEQLSPIRSEIKSMQCTMSGSVLPEMRQFRDELGSIHETITSVKGKIKDHEKSIGDLQINRRHPSERVVETTVHPSKRALKSTVKTSSMSRQRGSLLEYRERLARQCNIVRKYLIKEIDNPVKREKLRAWFLDFTKPFFPSAAANIEQRFDSHTALMYLAQDDFAKLDTLHAVFDEKLTACYQ